MQKHCLGCWNAILIRYYSHTPKARAWIESMDEHAGWPTGDPPIPDWLGVYHWTVPELTVQVHWQPGLPIWQLFRLDPDPDPKWRSGTVANTKLVLTQRHRWWILLVANHYHPHHDWPLDWSIYLGSIVVPGHTHNTFKCGSTPALPIPHVQFCRPWPPVIIIAELDAAPMAICPQSAELKRAVRLSMKCSYWPRIYSPWQWSNICDHVSIL